MVSRSPGTRLSSSYKTHSRSLLFQQDDTATEIANIRHQFLLPAAVAVDGNMHARGEGRKHDRIEVRRTQRVQRKSVVDPLDAVDLDVGVSDVRSRLQARQVEDAQRVAAFGARHQGCQKPSARAEYGRQTAGWREKHAGWNCRGPTRHVPRRTWLGLRILASAEQNRLGCQQREAAASLHAAPAISCPTSHAIVPQTKHAGCSIIPRPRPSVRRPR